MKSIFICVLLLIPSFSFSTPSVKHSHNGRTHAHPLPNNGVGSHSHNMNRKSTKKKVMHNHGQRRHSHILPSSGIKHQHSKSVKTEEYTQVNSSPAKKEPITEKQWEESLHKDFKRFAAGSSLEKLVTLETKNGTNLIGWRSKRRAVDKNASIQSLSAFKADSTILGINGYGELAFSIGEDTFPRSNLIGQFKNGLLIKADKIRTVAKVSSLNGWGLKYLNEEIEVNEKTNIVELIIDEYNRLQRKSKKEELIEKRKISPLQQFLSSPSNSQHCLDGDKCYSDIARSSEKTFEFNCIKGERKGMRGCVSYDPDPKINNKYGACGVPYSYLHKTLHEAANWACN